VAFLFVIVVAHSMEVYMSSPTITFQSTVAQYGVDSCLNEAQRFAGEAGYVWGDGTSIVFKVSCDPLFSPNFRGITSNEQAISKWVNSYFSDYNNRPSVRMSNPPGTIHDPALDLLINARLPHLHEIDLVNIKYAHRLGMSAENIFGTILEEYLASKLAPYHWYCAWGSVVKAVDFVSSEGHLLQVKSRNNTENSSSNKIRAGTTINKWWRFHATNGSTNWPALNTLLGINIFSEQDFQNFVQRLVSANPNVMAVENTNSWKL
jgi:hypothetical protein